ncbi:MAG: lipopolysaccharide kinase InaA family protein [Gammaproteobacteria bacterium]|nr:lipopolysaccharide kinase InaA family protein [Gammaproteobacteria bacterium]
MIVNLLKNWLFPKKIDWTIVPEYQQTTLGERIKNFDDAFNLKGEFIDVKVFKISAEGKHFYLKQYFMFKRFIPRYISFSKVKTEWTNLLMFERLGIPAAKLVAYGQETRGRVVHRGVLITEELLNCHDLTSISDNFNYLLQDSKWVSKVSHQIAEVARTLHGHNFAHNDFKWRNIMVDIKADFPQIYLIDCPAGMKWYKPFLEYRIIKDLACLDKRAKYELSAKQRLTFYKDYAQCKKLSSKDKKRIRKILHFFHNRE